MKYSIFILLLASFMLNGCEPGEDIGTTETGQLRHVVLFNFTDSSTTEEIQRIEEAFAALPSQIDVIRDFNGAPTTVRKASTKASPTALSSPSTARRGVISTLPILRIRPLWRF